MDALWAKYSSSNLLGLCLGAVDDRVAMAKCYGKKAPGSSAHVDVRTLFRVESVSKTFAATLLALRVQEGSVKLNDPVKTYVPVVGGQPVYPTSLTLAQLAEHYSGLPKPTPKTKSLVEFFLTTGACLTKTSCRKDVPGHSYLYSNWAFSLLGNVLGAHDGVRDGPLGVFEPDVVTSITGPLGMPSTRSLPDWILEHPAAFAAHVSASGEEGKTEAPYGDAGGGMYSDARDMLKWLRFSMGLSGPSNVLAAHHLLYDDATHCPREHGDPNAGCFPTDVPNEWMGLAWDVNKSTGTTCVWKGGDGQGFHAYVTFVNGVRRGVFLLFNSDPSAGKFKIGKALLNSLPATPGAGSPTC